jgi:hypothetical protein
VVHRVNFIDGIMSNTCVPFSVCLMSGTALLGTYIYAFFLAAACPCVAYWRQQHYYMRAGCRTVHPWCMVLIVLGWHFDLCCVIMACVSATCLA